MLRHQRNSPSGSTQTVDEVNQTAPPHLSRAQPSPLAASPSPSEVTLDSGSPKGASFRDRISNRAATRPIQHGTPGERTVPGNSSMDPHGNQARLRTQYFEEQFACRDAGGFVREKVLRASPVLAELRTNVDVSCLSTYSYKRSADSSPSRSVMVTLLRLTWRIICRTAINGPSLPSW